MKAAFSVYWHILKWMAPYIVFGVFVEDLIRCIRHERTVYIVHFNDSAIYYDGLTEGDQ